MKAYFIALFVLALTFTASAQRINSGTWLVSSDSRFSYSTTKPENGDAQTSILRFGATAGHFVIPNLALGLGLSLTDSKTDIAGASLNTNTLAYGAFARYYFGGRVYVGGGYYYTSAEIGTSLGPGTLKVDGHTIPLELGYAAFLSNMVAIEPGIIYSINENSSTLLFGLGFTLYLGQR